MSWENIKSFFLNEWRKFKASSFRRFIYALVWTFVTGTFSSNFLRESIFLYLLPAMGFWYVLWIALKLLVYAWIINPMNRKEKIKKK